VSHAALSRKRRVQSSSERGTGPCSAIPVQLVYVQERGVSPEYGECSEDYRAIPFAAMNVRDLHGLPEVLFRERSLL
jgi:hypothetical protein